MKPSADELNSYKGYEISNSAQGSCPADDKFCFNPNNFLILVVDDNNQNLQLIGDILEEAGYETTFAMSGKRAFERIATAQPDLILLDLMMPVMDGLEVCTQLKANPVYRSIPIIFLTASTEKDDLVKAFKLGTVDEYGQLPRITCYASQLNQVLINLLNNAIEALDKKALTQGEMFGEPPTIKITTDVVRRNDASLPTSNFISIQIADNGCGIPPEIQPQIFDPFFTTKPVGSGMGLGLAISYQIVVETHKGNLRCVSSPYEGTQMIVEIPFCGGNW